MSTSDCTMAGDQLWPLQPGQKVKDMSKSIQRQKGYRRFPPFFVMVPKLARDMHPADSLSCISVPADPGVLHDWGTKCPVELEPQAVTEQQASFLRLQDLPGQPIQPSSCHHGIPWISPATTAGVFVLHVRARCKPPILKQPP